MFAHLVLQVILALLEQDLVHSVAPGVIATLPTKTEYYVQREHIQPQAQTLEHLEIQVTLVYKARQVVRCVWVVSTATPTKNYD